MQRSILFGLAWWLAAAVAVIPARTRADEVDDKIRQLEQELEQLKRTVEEQKEEPPAQPAAVTPPATEEEAGEPFYREVLDRVKMGAYGSFRFEHNSLDDIRNTFTLRRVVLTTDAQIAPRLRSYFELEFERFRKLEVEKTFDGSDEGLEVEQAIEATNKSEIALEQMWLQFDFYDWLRLRGGAILVPVGRFNINHDDNRWDLPRRPLVDRGSPVLPSKSAWDELGVGFNGEFELTESLLGSYELYVMNGVSLDTEIEQIAESREGDTTLIETEVKVSPSTGTFDIDNKDAKALSGRFALSPSLGSEIAASFYWGRYTPDFLPNEDVYSISADGIYHYGPFAIEGEYAYTHFGGIKNVARGFAERAINSESVLENDQVENEVKFELADLAEHKQGYWVEFRYSFWPQFLNRTPLGSPFSDPRLIAVFRPEQVWFGGLVDEITFENSTLTTFDDRNTRLDRLTWGLAYRPVPLVVLHMAFEWYHADNNTSLAQVTNFLPAGPGENEANAFLIGAAFGF